MRHHYVDLLLKVFYGEASADEERDARKHLADCEDCRGYLQLLNQLGMELDRVPEEQPLPETFDLIMNNIPVEQPKVSFVRKPVVSALPFFQIAFSLLFIVLSIYFVESKISLLPIWSTLQESWLIQTIGSFGFVMLVFFAIGTFITLSLAPILYFDINKKALRI